jgi:hypothetical protein
VSLLDSHRPVFPLQYGSPGNSDDWSVADWCHQCHRKRGLVVWPDLPRLTPDAPQGEALAAILLGYVDAFEISAFRDNEPQTLADWYALLDCGLRMPLVGGSGKDSNAVAAGAVRTYARLQTEENLSYGTWVGAVRAGRTFVTNGPLLTLEVDGEGPGHVFTAVPQGRPVNIRLQASGTVPFNSIEVVYNGEVVATKTASGNCQATTLETGFRLEAPGWLAARCRGAERLADGQIVFAHTSPIWFHPAGTKARPTQDVVRRLLAILDRTIEWTRQSARYDNPKSREHLLGVLREARQNLTG